MKMNEYEIKAMEHKVKAEVLDLYGLALKTLEVEKIDALINQAYGIIQFACNHCFPKYNEELGKWWQESMLPKFENIK